MYHYTPGTQPKPEPCRDDTCVPTYRFVVRDLRHISMRLAASAGTRMRVADDVVTRARAGREKYGTHLCPYNGRDHMVDAYEEAVDLALYLQNAMRGGMNLPISAYVSALELACALRSMLDQPHPDAAELEREAGR